MVVGSTPQANAVGIVVDTEVDDVAGADRSQTAQLHFECGWDIGDAQKETAATAVVEDFVGVSVIHNVVVDGIYGVPRPADEVGILADADKSVEGHEGRPFLNFLVGDGHEPGLPILRTRVHFAGTPILVQVGQQLGRDGDAGQGTAGSAGQSKASGVALQAD